LSVRVAERRASPGDPALVAGLSRLHAAGAEVVLANFGSGDSGLATLRALPLDVVRIDRSVVEDMASDSGRTSLTRALIQLAHGMRLRVIAEGVDNEELLRQLVDHGCDLAQGNCFGSPHNAGSLQEILRSGASMPLRLLNARARSRTLLLAERPRPVAHTAAGGRRRIHPLGAQAGVPPRRLQGGDRNQRCPGTGAADWSCWPSNRST
ncbi:MAG: EAL domain-containing protein, partial [Hydrogenophaga sp.]|nr:EAL domain-containing protein [Hydrogenophaga sp.]